MSQLLVLLAPLPALGGVLLAMLLGNVKGVYFRAVGR